MTCKRSSVQRWQVGLRVAFRFFSIDPEDEEEEEKAVQLALATLCEVVFEPPGPTPAFARTLTITDAGQGEAEYFTIRNDLGLVGPWKAQGHTITPEGDFWSEILEFEVLDNLGPTLIFREPRAAALEMHVPQIGVVMS